MAVRATLTASLAAVALVAAVQAAAAPRMDDVCKYVDRRGNVDYRDCAPPTTYVEPVAPVSLAFLVMHWKVARQPFLVSLGGLAAALVGYYVLGVGT